MTRIDEIKVEADVFCDQNYPGASEAQYSLLWEDQFAELIVLECANWIVDNAGAMEHLGPSYFAKAMQKHFGVNK